MSYHVVLVLFSFVQPLVEVGGGLRQPGGEPDLRRQRHTRHLAAL